MWQRHLVRCLYRPFDWRFCYFNEVAVDRPRPELRQHMLQPNISLNVTRQTKADEWKHALVANTPTPAIYTEIKDGSNAFPLYLYPDANKKGLFDTNKTSNAPGGRHPNISPKFIGDVTNKLNMQFIPDSKGDLQHTFGPEDIFNYMYAIFHSPTYRSRYVEFLKIDFPRLPLTSNVELFRELCKLGDRLVGLHLMEQYGQSVPKYPVTGNNVVERVEYTQPAETPEQGRVWINKTQYFEGVPPDVWEFHIGGYQVCQKWLKDRKGRVLTFDDIRHYQRIVAALAETKQSMEQVDETIDEHGGWPIE
jgi:predicted helicase